MLELKGPPVINDDEISRRDISEFTPSISEHIGAAFQSNYELNPVQQRREIDRLRELDVGDSSYTDEFGQTQPLTHGLDPSVPEARRLSVDEANDKGKEVGLRFSEPPTQAQFNFLADKKREENSRDETLSHAPTISARSALGLTAGLAASFLDPLNLAVSAVPVVSQARYAKLALRFGAQRARLITGALEGGVGNALITPFIYTQAQQLQQEYDLGSAFNDIVLGAALGSGLHWAGGGLLHKLRGREATMQSVVNTIREADPSAKWVEDFTTRRRGSRVQDGENPLLHESLKPEERAQVLNAAVKAVESDQMPKMDELLGTQPRLAEMAIPDKRFPATVKLRSHLGAADYATGSQAASVIDMATASRLQQSKAPQTPRGLFNDFGKRFKKLSGTSMKEVTPAEFGQQAATMLDHPNQRTVYDPATKSVLVTEGASLGAVRHEIERALDDAYKVSGSERGGYRYNRNDLDSLNAHRAAMGMLAEESPDRVPPVKNTPKQAVSSFGRDPDPILNKSGPGAADRAWEVVEQGKDKQLDRIIADEEIGVVESIVGNIQGTARDLGIMDKVIPAEEREILAEAFARQGKGDLVGDLFSTVNRAVESGSAGRTLSDAEVLLKAGPERLAEAIKGEKTTQQVIEETAPGLVTRIQAAKSIKSYLGKRASELSGEPYERAIRMVQDGEDVDKAVGAVMEGGDLLTKADQAAREPEPAVADLKAPGEKPESEDLWGDIVDEAVAILDKGKITDKRDLIEAESRFVQEEQAALDANPKTRDLHSAIEETEFDEADRNRALREGTAAPSGGGGGRAGAGGAGDAHPASLQEAAFGRDGQTVGSEGLAAEREGAAPGGERPAPETALSYGGWNIPRRVVTPDGSIEVSIEPKIVELRNLVHAEGDLQVRDRSRKESKVEALDRARKLDPDQLLPNRVADAGAPIVIDENGRYTIISGNGRVLSLREVYSNEALGFKAQQYRERLGPAADGYRSPVLVSVITDKLSHADLVRLAERANRSRIAEMSVTEKAQRDADVAGGQLMGLYQGGDFTKKENQPFLRAFMNKVVTEQERGEMSKNGVLTKPGVDRLNAALLAAAYDDTGVLSFMLESTDNNVKSIASAYRDVAPVFMKLRAEIAQGLVREEMDITPFMMEAVRFVQKAREDGIKIVDALAQVDALNPMDPVVDKLVRQFYNPQLTRANSSLRISENLRLYAEAAREKRLGGFFEDATTALDVMGAAERKLAREADEALLAADEENLRAGPEVAGREAPQPAPTEPRQLTDLGSEGAGPAETDRSAAQATRAEFEALKVPEIRARAKAEGIVVKGRKKSEIIDSYLEASKAQPEPAPRQAPTEPRPLTDAEIDALPDVAETSPQTRAVEASSVSAFYDFLEGAKPIKNATAIAKELGVNQETAYRLLDHAEAHGWVKLKDDGTYIRVPKAARPPRPDAAAEFALDGFYSPAIRAAEDIRQEKGTGEQFWKQISKVPGVKKDELDWMGLEEFLKDKQSVTKAEVLDFMRAHQVQLDEKVLGSTPGTMASRSEISIEKLRNFLRMDEDELPDQAYTNIERFALGDQQAFVVYDPHGPAGGGWFVLDDSGNPMAASGREQAVHMATGLVASESETAPKFSAYKVPGGENYRELLIRLPELGKRELSPEQTARLDQINARARELSPLISTATGQDAENLIAERRALASEGNAIEQSTHGYKSKHFQDQEIVHLRVDDRIGPNGEKVLFINEVQSDLHQQGRRIGYGKSKEELRATADAADRDWQEHLAKFVGRPVTEATQSPEGIALRQRLDEAIIAANEQTVPNAPFKSDLWLELALKRALLYASENGYDAISWARSDQIAKAVGAEPEKLALQYDQKIGKFLDKYTKKWGGKVESGFRLFSRAEKSDSNPILRITPEMRESVRGGQPMFSEAPRGWESAGYDFNQMERLQLELQSSLAIQRAIGMALKAMPESIRVKIIDTLDFRGRSGAGVTYYGRNAATGLTDVLIAISRDLRTDPINTLHHELLHALRAIGLFTNLEWKVFRDTFSGAPATERESRYFAYFEERAWSGEGGMDLEGFVADKMVEERAATDFGRWVANRVAERETPIGRLWGRVQDFIRDLHQAFINLGRRAQGLAEKPTLEQIYRSIIDGDFAQRFKDWGLDKVGPDNPISVNRQAGDEFAAMLNRQMGELAHDDSASIASAVETALQSLAPCAAHNL